jgi:hypothetical protein
MATTFATLPAGSETRDPDYAALEYEGSVPLEIELLDYLDELETVATPDTIVFGHLDPYGEAVFEPGQLAAVRDHVLTLSSWLKRQAGTGGEFPVPPGIVGVENAPTACGFDGVITFLNRLYDFLGRAESRSQPVVALGD